MSGDSERQRFSVPVLCADSGERSGTGLTDWKVHAVQCKGKMELHWVRRGQEVPLGRHMVALLIGAEVCLILKGQ